MNLIVDSSARRLYPFETSKKDVMKISTTLLSFVMLSYSAAAAEYKIEDGDGGLETFFPASKGVDLVGVQGAETVDVYKFELVISVGEDAPTTIRRKLKMKPEATVSGQVCLNTTCRLAEFSLSDYFNGPSTYLTFPKDQVGSAKGIFVKMPNGISLEWAGNTTEAFDKVCKNTSSPAN